MGLENKFPFSLPLEIFYIDEILLMALLFGEGVFAWSGCKLLLLLDILVSSSSVIKT